MERTLARLDRCLVELIAEHTDLAELSERLRSVPAVGPVLATTLIALLPELGSLTRRQVASLVGVAPFDRSSGRQIGAKSIQQAERVFVRNTLYMAALVASRHNPAIAAFAERLAGKPGKVRLVPPARTGPASDPAGPAAAIRSPLSPWERAIPRRTGCPRAARPGQCLAVRRVRHQRQRRRIMSYPLVIPLVIAMTLMPDASYCEALARLAGLLADIPFALEWHVPTEKVVTGCRWSRRI